MKRFLSILLVAMLLMSAGLFLDEPVKAEEYATVTSANGYGVRLRSGPSTAYGVITKYPVGTTVIVLQRGAAWSQLQVGSNVGWMDNTFLSFGTSGGSVPSGSGTGDGVVWSGNGLRVWLRATAGGKRLALYKPGTMVNILEKGDKWCRVNINGAIGYMMTQFIRTDSAVVPVKKISAVSVNYNHPIVNDVLTATVTPADATASFVWTVDDVVCSTSSEMLVLDRFAGKKIKVSATGTGSYTGTAVWTTESVQTDPWVKSVALNNPTPAVGDVLSAIIQPSSADVEYSWRVNGTPVSTEATYTVKENDSGKLIQLKVTGKSNILGTASVTADRPVTDGKQLLGVELSNTQPKPGDVLKATVYPAAANAELTWTADNIVEGNGATYTVKVEDMGKVIRVSAKGVTPYQGTVSASTGRVEKAYLTGVTLSTAAPCAGRSISAAVTPADATVTYQWYADGEAIAAATGKTYTPGTDMADKKLSVKVTGTGVYGGSITSTETAAVIKAPTVVAVRLDNVTPVVGDTVKAVVVFDPAVTDEAEYNALTAGFTYLWYVDNEKQANNSVSYDAKASDVTKHLRVRVIGTATTPADVTSAYSDRVKDTKTLKGVAIHIGSKDGAMANAQAPEVGQTLYAVVSPAAAEDKVSYEWFADGAPLTSGKYITLTANEAGKRITVKVKGTTDYYTGELQFTSAAVVKKTPLVENFTFTPPEKGITPTYSAKAVNSEGKTIATASIRWLAEDGSPAELDEFGTFKPATKYKGEFTVKLENGYTLVGAAPTLNGAAVNGEVKGNVITHTFTTEGDMAITDLYITALPKPMAGDEAVTSFETAQFSASVNWTAGVTGGYFDTVETYKADITLTPKSGYAVNGLPANAFTVQNASKTTYAAGSNTVSVEYQINRVLNVVADAAQVELDGTNDQLVVCYATLSDYDGSLDSSVATWSLLGEISNTKTSINENGLVYIAGNEPVGKSLTVKCEATVGGKKYTAEKQISLVSGATNNTISVVFETVHNSVIAGGSSLKFKAHAINSNKGVTYYVESDSTTSPLSHTSINATTGELTVGVSEQAKSVVVVAQSVEAGQTAIAKWEVVIVHQNIETKKLKKLALETAEKNFPFGKNLSAMTFPKAILTYEDDSTAVVDVNWDYTSVSPAYDPSKADGSDFSIAGSVILPGDVVNPNSVSTSVLLDVHVASKQKLFLKGFTAPTWSVSALKNGISEAEIIAALPQTVACELNTKEDFAGEASTGKLDILWDAASITPAYDSASTEKSTFAISGTVDMSAYENPAALSAAVSLTVTVEAKGLETKVISVDTTSIDETKAYDPTITDESLENLLDSKREVVYMMGDNTLTAEFPVSWSCTNSYDHGIPTQQIVTFVGTVQLSGIDNPDNIPTTIYASVAVAAQPAKLELSASSYTFPECDVYLKDTYTATYSISVTNRGGTKATTVGVASSGSSAITYDVSGLPATLEPGQYGIITVSVDPSLIVLPDTYQTTLSIKYDGWKSEDCSLELVVTPKKPVEFSASVSPKVVQPGEQSVTFTVNINDPYDEFAAKNGKSFVDTKGWFEDGATYATLTITDTFTLGEDKTYTVVATNDDGTIGEKQVTVTVSEGSDVDPLAEEEAGE